MQIIRKFANGRWYECRKAENGFWYIHWSENRRSLRATTRQKEISAAQAYLDEWLSLAAAEAAFEARPTIGDLWAAKYAGAPERVMNAWKHLQPVFGHLRPSEVTDAKERAYGAARGVALSTLRLELSLIRSVWNHAIKRRMIRLEDTPVLNALPEPSPPRERHLSADEVARVLSAAEPCSRVWAFAWVASETAARRTAVQELRWSQVDFAVGVICFLPEGQRQTRKRRATVPISARLLPVLLRLKAQSRDQFVIGAGGRINEALRLVAAKAGVAGVTPHVFRHTAATQMAKENVSIWIIAQILGNTVEQVEKVYAKWQPQAHQNAVNLIGKDAA